MTMSISQKNENGYFLLDKIIISEDRVLNFDIFIKTPQGSFLPFYAKEEKLTKDIESKLLDEETLYIHNSEKERYYTLFNKLITPAKIPTQMESLYMEFSKHIDNIFTNPESLKNVETSKRIVNNMINNIMDEKFNAGSLITILCENYYMHTHSLNVSVYALCLGKQIGLNKNELEDLGTAALLHDIGKSQIHKAIINKKAKLTSNEFNAVKKHPVFGYEIAQKLQIKNKAILLGILQHHEKMDGSGYPEGLKKHEIHQYARIIAICDIFDALTTKRSYKKEVSTFDTLMMMKKEMSAELDMDLVNSFIQVFYSKSP